MIQRKQTVFLALAAAALLASFLVPIRVGAAGGQAPAVASGLCALIAVGGIYAIFQYADRSRQRSLVLGLQYATLIAILIVLGAQYVLRDASAPIDPAAWALAAAPPALAYVLFLLARKSIEHDIALVRSMDRLR